MTHAPQIDATLYPRTYRASRGWKIFFRLLGALVILPSLAGLWYFGTVHEVQTKTQMIAMTSICAAFVLLGAYLILAGESSAIVLTADAVSVPGFMRTVALARADISGYRVLAAQGIKYLHIIKRDGKKLNIGLYFQPDAAFVRWFEGIPDLDAEALAQSVREVAEDASLGASPEERLRKLDATRKVGRAIYPITIAIAAWAFFYPQPYRLVFAILVLMPWVALALCATYRGRFTLEDSGMQTARTDLTLMLIIPSSILGIRALLDVHLMDPMALLGFVAVGTPVILVALVAAEPKLRGKVGKLLMVAALMAPYPASVAAIGNAVFDYAPPTQYRVAVLDKHHTTGKNSAQYLALGAWGPHGERNEVTVDRELYNRVQRGQPVCIQLHAGALGMPFYIVRDEARCR